MYYNEFYNGDEKLNSQWKLGGSSAILGFVWFNYTDIDQSSNFGVSQ